MKYWIGMDLGGTNTVAGLLDSELNVVRTCKRPTGAKLGGEHVLAQMVEMIAELLAAEGIDRQQVGGVGAGIPGLINPEQGICTFAGNLGWNNLNVSARLRESTGLPVFIDNDVRMYTYGEAVKGAGRGAGVVLGLTLGTGLAAALIDHGKLYYGGGFMAGELGHIKMEGENSRCGCGLTGCLETVASGTGIARVARERIAAGAPSVMLEMSAHGTTLTAAHVSAAYDQGDPVARDVLDYVGRTLGRGLATAVTLFSPDALIIGGGAANAGERLLAPMREELQKHVLPMYWNRLSIHTAELGDDAGLIGSAAFARNRVESAGSTLAASTS